MLRLPYNLLHSLHHTPGGAVPLVPQIILNRYGRSICTGGVVPLVAPLIALVAPLVPQIMILNRYGRSICTGGVVPLVPLIIINRYGRSICTGGAVPLIIIFETYNNLII